MSDRPKLSIPQLAEKKKAGEPLFYARSKVVHAAEQARDLGFAGKGLVHPKQIAALNEVFTPTEADQSRPADHYRI